MILYILARALVSVSFLSTLQHTVTVSSGTDSDEDDIIRTTLITSKKSSASNQKMARITSQSDKLLKVC